MLRDRFLAASAFIVILMLALWADFRYLHDSLLLHAVVLAGTFFCFREFWPMCRAAGHQTFSNWGTFSGCALVAVHYWSMQIWTVQYSSTHLAEKFRYLHKADNLLGGAMVTAVLGAFFLTARRRKLPASLGGLGVTCLGLIYIWFLPSFVLKLRHMGEDGLPGGAHWNAFGSKMVIATIVVAKGCDVFAFLVGRKLGGAKAFPNVSPGKTQAGVAAGLLGSVLLAFLLRWAPLAVLPAHLFGIAGTLIFGLLIGFSGMMGDLAESLLKRSAGLKDASAIVPGYGGVLDVVDSLVVAGPVAYFLVPVILGRF